MRALIIDLDGGYTGPPGVTELEIKPEFGWCSTQEEIRDALKKGDGQDNFDVEAEPTETNPCKRGEYWDFQEQPGRVIGTIARLFYAYQRSRRYHIIVEKDTPDKE